MSRAEIQRRPGSRELDLDPTHVARVVVALASPAAAGITGRVPHAGGGHLREYVTERRKDTALLEMMRSWLADE